MAKYWQKRPVFEAVQLKPKNVKKIKARTATSDVGFSDKCCYFTLYGRPMQEPITSWLVTDPQGRVSIASDYEFNMVHERVEKKKA